MGLYTLRAWKTEYAIMWMSLGTKILNTKQKIHKHEMKGKKPCGTDFELEEQYKLMAILPLKNIHPNSLLEERESKETPNSNYSENR